MKISSLLRSPLFIILVLFFIILGFLGLNKISKLSYEKSALTNDQIDKVKSNLKIISSITTNSSIPMDKVKGHEKEYNEIIQMGEPVVDFFIDEFKKGKLEGSNEWITAWICNEILGNKNPVKIWAEDHENGWDSGRDWYEKYIKSKNIK
jgi:hypothetical protein